MEKKTSNKKKDEVKYVNRAFFKIYSIVDANTFQFFRSRAKNDGIKMDKALTELAKLYAHGHIKLSDYHNGKTKNGNHSKSNNANYLKDHGVAE